MATAGLKEADVASAEDPNQATPWSVSMEKQTGLSLGSITMQCFMHTILFIDTGHGMHVNDCFHCPATHRSPVTK